MITKTNVDKKKVFKVKIIAEIHYILRYNSYTTNFREGVNK